ncbi:MAG: hypothetical protein QME76_07070 [Bacillota bacterium]|nr:hypothetical protein [Bacillota bacterium]
MAASKAPAETSTPVVARHMRYICRIVADRGDDFVAYGKQYLWGESAAWEEVDPQRFQIIQPADGNVRATLKRYVGKVVEVSGPWDTSYGSGQSVVVAKAVQSAGEELVPACSPWCGWGPIWSTESGGMVDLQRSQALGDWVTFLKGVQTRLDIPDLLPGAERNGQGRLMSESEIAALIEERGRDPRYAQEMFRLRQAFKRVALVAKNDGVKDFLRADVNDVAFVTGLALSNRFIDTAKVRTPHVEALTKHIDSAHERAGLGSDLGPVSQYGYVSFDDYLIETVVSGAAGYSFGEWMGFFDGSEPPRQCTWVVRGIDREKYEGRMVWVAGTRCWDPLSKHFFIAARTVMTREEFWNTYHFIQQLMCKQGGVSHR